MKRLLPFVMLLMSAGSVSAGDLTSRHSSSVQLTVEGPAIQSTRLGSSYSVSGSNINVTTLGGLNGGSATAAPTLTAGSYAINTNGDAFNFAESSFIGDTPVTSQVALTSGGRIEQPNLYSDTTSQLGGTAGTLAGTINTAGVMTLTAGGAGTTATGQFVTEITVR
jgi:hypothetical protein